METSTRLRLFEPCEMRNLFTVGVLPVSSTTYVNAKHPLAIAEDAGPSTDVAQGKSRVR